MTPYVKGYSDCCSGRGYCNPYDYDTIGYNSYNHGREDALKILKKDKNPEEITVKKIRLKPIISEVEIDGGSWKYVVLNENNKAVAMFVLYEEAESYIDNIAYCSENYTIREYDGEN